MIDKQAVDQTLAPSTDQADARPAPRSLRMFRAFSHPNYRRFWISAFISNVGTWMQAVAQGWLVLQLTNSPFWLGLDGFMATVPGLFLVLAGGVFADLVDRKRLMIYTQIVAGASALTLAVLVHTGTVNVSMVLALSFVTGCCMALASPSYQAITIDLVSREDLANAVALNSSQFQLSRLVGPLLAGLGFRFFGLAGCFYANSISFLAVIIGFRKLQIEERGYIHSVKDSKAFLRDLVAGFTYVRRRPRVFSLLSLSAVTSLFGFPYLTFIPVFARDIFHLGETGLALMMGAAGGGAFVGALTLAYLGDFRRKGWSVLGGAIAFGVWLMAFAQSSNLIFSLISLFGVGFAVVTSVAVTNTLLQKLVTDEMRGRVMSMFILSFIGTMPFGNLIAGALSQRFGAPGTLTGSGLVIILFVTAMAIGNKRLRNLH